MFFPNYVNQFFSLFKGKTNNNYLQLFRYTFVGGFAFLIDFGTLFLLTKYLNIHYLLSAFFAFILGIVTNYILSVKWVFYKRTIQKKWLEFLLFTLIGLTGLALNQLFLWVLTDIFLIYYLLSKLITSFILYFWNFLIRKILLFNK
jgi:putative flippase GtrA